MSTAFALDFPGRALRNFMHRIEVPRDIEAVTRHRRGMPNAIRSRRASRTSRRRPSGARSRTCIAPATTRP